ncbi:hypothetical protein CHARACLAT_007886 [Characodon lateralis]|uniref:Uncharacterized protein n=1 Tax=Characodon lateralis TaxID=208331 RepID=A0ABU7DGY2_9TELE|nr:hypothetical protein [Characodon lateralis]
MRLLSRYIPPLFVYLRWSLINLWSNSPALTEDAKRKEPSRSSSSAAADKPGLAILLLFLAELHILRGPFITSHLRRARRASGVWVPEGGLVVPEMRLSGTCKLQQRNNSRMRRRKRRMGWDEGGAARWY